MPDYVKEKIRKAILKRKALLGYINSPKTRENMRIAQIGSKKSLKTKNKMSKSHKGYHPKSEFKKGHQINFKGDNIQKGGIHDWLRNKFGKANKCENKNCKNLSKKYDWSLLKGKKYKRIRNNFWMLCRSCHNKYDGNWEKTQFKKNHIPFNKGKKCPWISENNKKRRKSIS